MGFLASWEMESESLENVPKDVKQKMCLSRETIEGLRITGKYLSIVLVKARYIHVCVFRNVHKGHM